MPKPIFEVRDSAIQGSGAFATRRILKGTRIVEYIGERISTEEADERYGDMSKHPHVVLFIVDKRTVIDGGAGGNDARFFNHSCEPNCQTIMEKKRIYVEALHAIEEGDELTYDYHLDFGVAPTEEDKKQYACLCGAASCRGTMLAPIPEKKPRAAKKVAAKKKAAKKKA